MHSGYKIDIVFGNIEINILKKLTNSANLVGGVTDCNGQLGVVVSVWPL